MTQPPNTPDQPGQNGGPAAPEPPQGPAQPAPQQPATQQEQGQQGHYQQSQPKAQGAGLGELLSFEKFQTPKHAKTFFLAIVVLTALWWFFGIIDTFVNAFSYGGAAGSFPIWMVLEALLFSWVVPVLVIVFGRLGVELTAAVATLAQKKD